jgi:6-pyruvoyltetrahydropterin/6-carboxytetrahydropterin synthase
MGSFRSTKIFDGYSCVFRQWKAEGTHCQFLHGYGVSFKVWFEGELDERNWVWDFGGMKRAKGTIDGMNPKLWMDNMFDHTVIISEDDPYLENFKEMWKDGIIQLRVIPATGAEQFAKYIYEKLNTFIQEETNGRVKIVQVEFREHKKNTAFYKEDVKPLDVQAQLSKKDMENYLNNYRSNSKYEF